MVPVCAGISLEYYFSFVDNDRYGCGTKLPHNVTGLVGVMDGHASDLRTGLPWQMVEIHEPVRMLFVIETTPQRLTKVIDASAALKQLVENRWIRVATIDPESGRVHVRRDGGFEEFDGPLERLPVALSSAEWYGGKLDSIFPWPGFRPKQETDKSGFFAIHAGVCGAGARRGLRCVGAAVAAGLGATERVVSRITGVTFSASILALAVIVWRLGATGLRRSRSTFGNWFTVHDYHFPLVLMADRLSAAVPRHDGGAVGADRAVLGDLPASRARFSAVLPAAAPLRVRIFAGLRGRFVRPAGGADGRWWASLRYC